MGPKKTPPSKRNKRNERPSSSPGNVGEDSTDSHFDLLARQKDTSTGRERSLSKRRKTSEQQQQKITNFTNNQERSKNQTEGGETEIVQDKDDENATLTAILSRMERGMEDGRKQSDRVSLQLEKILSEIFDIKKENEFLRKKIESLQNKCSDLCDDVSRLQKDIKQEKELRNSLEQYTRKDNFKIINLPGDSERETAEETETKVIELIRNKLGLTSFQSMYISVAHRVGKYTTGQNRPIIVRLTTRKIKTEIFKMRKKLRQEKSNMFINEDLTKLNAQRLYAIKQHPAVLSAWSFQGKLYSKLLDLRIINIEDGDIQKIDRVLLESGNSTNLRQQSFRHPAGSGATSHRGGRGDNWTVRINRGSSQRSVHSNPPTYTQHPPQTPGTSVQDRQPDSGNVTQRHEASPPTQVPAPRDDTGQFSLERSQDRVSKTVPAASFVTGGELHSPRFDASMEVFENSPTQTLLSTSSPLPPTHKHTN